MSFNNIQSYTYSPLQISQSNLQKSEEPCLVCELEEGFLEMITSVFEEIIGAMLAEIAKIPVLFYTLFFSNIKEDQMGKVESTFVQDLSTPCYPFELFHKKKQEMLKRMQRAQPLSTSLNEPARARRLYSLQSLHANREEMAKQAPVSASLPTPYLETYWESWDLQNPTDFCSQLSGVPVGSGVGKVQVVDIAFCDYTFGKDNQGNTTIGFVNAQTKADGEPFSPQDLKSAIQTLQAQGGKVKLSFGGATFSMSRAVTDQASAIALAQNIAGVVNEFGLDGVDFDIEDGTVSAALQLQVYQTLSSLIPGKLLSLTIPANGELYAPYATIINQGQQYFTSINVMAYDYYWDGYSFETEVGQLQTMGVAKSKIIRGVMPGQADDPAENVTPTMAVGYAQDAKNEEIEGLMTWDVNRDTNHRTGYAGNSVYQTNYPDGTFINAISQVFASTFNSNNIFRSS